MLLQPKYNYSKLTRVESNGSRLYVDGNGIKVPSVTTVLSKTGDKTALLNWRKRVGESEAQRISTESAGLGTRVHTALEQYVLGENWDNFGTNLVHQTAKRMTHSMVNKGFADIDAVWGVEVGLYAAGLYAGTSDAIGLHQGEPAIIDFKTAKKLKKREWIEDYFLQCAAYALCHNEMFGTSINKAVILMVDREAEFEQFIVKGDEFLGYQAQWAERLLSYYDQYH